MLCVRKLIKNGEALNDMGAAHLQDVLMQCGGVARDVDDIVEILQ